MDSGEKTSLRGEKEILKIYSEKQPAFSERLIEKALMNKVKEALPMANDSEIELLKKRKLQEMKRRLLLEKIEDMKKEEEKETKPARPRPKDVLKKVFVGRAWEVWNTAEVQYPTVTKEIAVALATLIEAGRLKGGITGEQLYAFFRRLGLRVRLKTKIRIYESGELKTIADKLRSE